jgi:hypothetical protein
VRKKWSVTISSFVPLFTHYNLPPFKHIEFLLSTFRQHVSTLCGHLQAFLWNKSVKCCVHLWDLINAYKWQCVNYSDAIQDTVSDKVLKMI